MTSTGKERIGVVGVGRMGLAMLKHLVKHGYAVTACDLDEKQLAKAREAGAATAGTPAALAILARSGGLRRADTPCAFGVCGVDLR